MRQGQQNKRMRGRNRRGPNPLTRSYESNGGDVKLRGTALHIAEKYVQLARDAQSSGDRVAAENYFQHAEHYYRIVAAAQAQMPQPQPIVRNDEGDYEDEGGEFRVNGNAPGGERPQVGQPGGGETALGLSDPQPFLNGAPDSDDGGDGGPEYNDGFPPPREQSNGGGGGGQRYQGHQQGQGHRQEGQGHFRRRRPFRDRYNDRDNRDRNAQGGGERGDRGDGDGGQGQAGGRPGPSSESSED